MVWICLKGLRRRRLVSVGAAGLSSGLVFVYVLSVLLAPPPFAEWAAPFPCDSGGAEWGSAGSVYWTVFAGRRDRLALQEKYWVQLYREGTITEVHLWDFTTKMANLTDQRLNRQWIEEKEKQYEFVKVMRMRDMYAKNLTAKHWKYETDPGKFRNKNWHIYYRYYGIISNHNDVILKVDDDILYVNVSEVQCFVKFVVEHVDVFTVSANVINNGVIAHIQQTLGMLPMSLGVFEYPSHGAYGSLWESPDKAFDLHRYFLSHKADFYRDSIVQYNERLSINFVAWSGRRSMQVYETVRMGPRGDEVCLTEGATHTWGLTNVIYMRLVVAHGSFKGQAPKNPKLDQEIVKLYKDAK